MIPEFPTRDDSAADVSQERPGPVSSLTIGTDLTQFVFIFSHRQGKAAVEDSYTQKTSKSFHVYGSPVSSGDRSKRI